MKIGFHYYGQYVECMINVKKKKTFYIDGMEISPDEEMIKIVDKKLEELNN